MHLTFRIRALACLLATCLVAACGASPSAPTAASTSAIVRQVVVLGDSLAVTPSMSESFPAVLQTRVAAAGLRWAVTNAGVSGDTTADGMTRFLSLLQGDAGVLVLELGANDGLRGLPVAQMTKNLGAMIEQAQKADAQVLILGMRLPPNYGPDYTQAFEAAFGKLAKRYHAALVPFFLEDVVKKPDLFQPDRIHPGVEAQPLILERVWTRLRPLLKSP